MACPSMRFTVLIPLVFLLCHCTPARELAASPKRLAAPLQAKIAPAAELSAAAEIPAASAKPAEIANQTVSGILFEGVAFDSRSHRLVVVDQAGGPGSRFADAAGAGRSLGGHTAANAGFFTPEGAPLGLVISRGNRVGAWNSGSSLGSGIWHADSSGKSAISRREHLGRPAASAMRELIQAGPMLVENGAGVSGLDATKPSIRTIILWDGGTRWWLGRSSICTLADLGAAFAQFQPAGWKVRHALNLDGGRSADFWVSDAIQGGPLVRRAAWNRPVRNFLVLVPL